MAVRDQLAGEEPAELGGFADVLKPVRVRAAPLEARFAGKSRGSTIRALWGPGWTRLPVVVTKEGEQRGKG
jgi:hypothetical protein